MIPAMAFVLGASIGSFLNVVADRLPMGRSIIRPRSSCSSCGKALSPRDLIPILSYVWLRGMCRYCAAPIPWRILLLELATGLLFLLLFWRNGLSMSALVLAMVGAIFLLLAVMDLEHGLVPDKVVLASLAAGLVVAPLWPSLGHDRAFLGSESMLASLLNSLVSAAGAFLLFLSIALISRGMGGGDVKLAAAVGLLLGFPLVVAALWLAFVVGGLVVGLLLALRLKRRRDPIPFVPFIAAGSLAALLAGGELTSLLEKMAGG